MRIAVHQHHVYWRNTTTLQYNTLHFEIVLFFGVKGRYWNSADTQTDILVQAGYSFGTSGGVTVSRRSGR